MSIRPAPWLRPLATMCLFGIVLFAQPIGERLALGAGHAGAGAMNSHLDHLVPMFPAAVDGVRQGFVRIINHSPRAGEIHIEAYDDGGARFGPVTLDIDADETVHFNSADLEDGNAAKGLAVGTGSGAGDWWLALSSDLDIEVLSYIRTPDDGFLTSMHDVVPADENGDYRVAIFNPGSNEPRQPFKHAGFGQKQPKPHRAFTEYAGGTCGGQQADRRAGNGRSPEGEGLHIPRNLTNLTSKGFGGGIPRLPRFVCSLPGSRGVRGLLWSC